MKQITSLYPLALAVISGKTYVFPGWIEVPMETTLSEIEKYRTLPDLSNIPGKGASNDEVAAYLQGKYITQNINLSERKEFLVDASKGNTQYTVIQQSGKWSCSCPGYGFRGRCKHIDNLKQTFIDEANSK